MKRLAGRTTRNAERAERASKQQGVDRGQLIALRDHATEGTVGPNCASAPTGQSQQPAHCVQRRLLEAKEHETGISQCFAGSLLICCWCVLVLR